MSIDYLSPVKDLSCDGICTWIPPYNPNGVNKLQYNITILLNDTVIIHTDTNNTSWLYCPLHIDDIGVYYELIVTPINALDIIGEPNTATGVIEEGINNNTHANCYH